MEDKIKQVIEACERLAPKRNQRNVVSHSLHIQNSLGLSKETKYTITSKMNSSEDFWGEVATVCTIYASLPANHINWELAYSLLSLGVQSPETLPIVNTLEWISVKDALPECNEFHPRQDYMISRKVLAYSPKSRIPFTTYLRCDDINEMHMRTEGKTLKWGMNGPMNEDVTHWMDLPTFPNGFSRPPRQMKTGCCRVPIAVERREHGAKPLW